MPPRPHPQRDAQLWLATCPPSSAQPRLPAAIVTTATASHYCISLPVQPSSFPLFALLYHNPLPTLSRSRATLLSSYRRFRTWVPHAEPQHADPYAPHSRSQCLNFTESSPVDSVAQGAASPVPPSAAPPSSTSPAAPSRFGAGSTTCGEPVPADVSTGNEAHLRRRQLQRRHLSVLLLMLVTLLTLVLQHILLSALGAGMRVE